MVKVEFDKLGIVLLLSAFFRGAAVLSQYNLFKQNCAEDRFTEERLRFSQSVLKHKDAHMDTDRRLVVHVVIDLPVHISHELILS